MPKSFTNSAIGDALGKAASPALSAIGKALAPKKPAPLPTMEQHADDLHPVTIPITPNRVTGKFSGE